MYRFLAFLLIFFLSASSGFSQSRNVGFGEISVIELANSGNVWVGSNGTGVSIFNGDSQAIVTFSRANTPQLPSDTITAILYCQLGGIQNIYVGTTKGLACYRDTTWDTISHVSGQYISGILLTAGDSLWVLTANNGAYIFDSTGQAFLGNINTGNSAIPTNMISTVQRGNNTCGSYTVGTKQSGCFYTVDGVTYNVLDTSAAGRGLIDNRVTAVYMKKDCSAMFVGTVAGYSSCPPGLSCTNFTTVDGLPQNYITAIGEDCNGKVWLGTQDSGIILYNPRVNATSKFADVYDSIQRSSYFLTKAPDGLMYGCGTDDGSYNAGLFFWFNPVTYTGGGFNLDTGFNAGNFWYPVGNPVAIDTAVWGVTIGGGYMELGTLYRFNTLTYQFNPYGEFDTASGGPPMGIVEGADGGIYGVTSGCSTYPYGTIFRYPIIPSRITRAAVFDSVTTGAHPSGSLTLGDNGLIYGSTPVGGAYNKGTLFQFNPVNNVLTKLYDFQGAPDGDNPSGPVIRCSNGLLYGTTLTGGSQNGGILFSFDSTSGTITKIHEFDLSLPTPNYLYQSVNGIFYGLTRDNNGSLFQYNRYNGAFNILYQFNNTDSLGTTPYPNMTENPQGNIFGRTSQGGLLGIGSIFQFDPQYQVFRKYTIADGLVSNQVTSIALDPDNCAEASFVGTSDGNVMTVDTAGNVTVVATGLRNILSDRAGVFIYPQPTDADVKLVFSRTISRGTLNITDVLGHNFAQYEISNQSLLNADVSLYPPGIYFFSVTNADQILASGKISVIR